MAFRYCALFGEDIAAASLQHQENSCAPSRRQPDCCFCPPPAERSQLLKFFSGSFVASNCTVCKHGCPGVSCGSVREAPSCLDAVQLRIRPPAHLRLPLGRGGLKRRGSLSLFFHLQSQGWEGLGLGVSFVLFSCLGKGSGSPPRPPGSTEESSLCSAVPTRASHAAYSSSLLPRSTFWWCHGCTAGALGWN